jgi:hypothetical protein
MPPLFYWSDTIMICITKEWGERERENKGFEGEDKG